MASPIFPENEPGGRPPAPTVVVQTQPQSTWQSWMARLLMIALGISVMANIGMFASFQEYFAKDEPPQEAFHSGDKLARNKIAVLTMSGTIMPPYTERLIQQIKAAEKADEVKGILLVVDSPGGLVADSHEIYYRLKKLSDKKPVYVQMKRMAASGGYYISMGAGPNAKIYAEPTTWTGSIGVIIPRYDVTKLAEKFGVDSAPIKTGEFKDALSPFRPLSDNERKVWENIIGQAFEQFREVIDSNRDTLTAEQVLAVATGEIFTAKDAKAKGLVDEIGYEEDSLEALKVKLGLKSVRVVTYTHPVTALDILLGASAKSNAADKWKAVMEASVPKALYFCSWLPPLPE